MQVKKEKNLLQNFQVCKISIEKSITAKYLEERFGIEWAFNQDTPLDSFFLRACIKTPVTIQSRKIIPVPTGIYPQLKSPNFRIECNSFTDLVYEQGLCLADGISTFEYSFRNEIWLLIENKFEQAQNYTANSKDSNFFCKL